jgi:hypothetical protein
MQTRSVIKLLTCPESKEKGLFRAILWGIPDDEFDQVKKVSGGCVIPSPWPPDCQCSRCGFEGYRDEISEFEM